MKSVFIKLCRIIVAISLVVSIIVTALFFTYDGNFREILMNYAKSVALARVNTILNDAVYDYLGQNGVEYSSLTDFTYSGDTVSSVKYNTVLINRIKSGIVSLIQKKVANQSEISVGVPVGTIIGNSFTYNRGPEIKTDVKISSHVKSKMISSFESAGINQTLHGILLNLDIDIYLVSPWYRTSSNVTSEFIITETIIVGKVPEAYTVVIESESDNTGGLINDYGAENFTN